jgi:Ubiquitin-activating enzyme E1 four-helix bundle
VPPGGYGLVFTDGAKFGRGEQLHLGLLALWEFQAQHGRLPEPGNTAEAEVCERYYTVASTCHTCVYSSSIVRGRCAMQQVTALLLKYGHSTTL